MARTKQVATKDVAPTRHSCPEIRRLVFDVAAGYDTKMCPRAVKIVQDSAEVYAMSLFSEAVFCANFGGRDDVTPRDIRLAVRMLGGGGEVKK